MQLLLFKVGKMKLLPLLLAIVFSCHFREINGQDGSGNGGKLSSMFIVSRVDLQLDQSTLKLPAWALYSDINL